METVMQTKNEANTSLVLRFVNEVINNKKFDLVDELWAQDMRWHGGSMGDVNGINDYKKMLTDAASGSFSNMLLQVKQVIASDNKVVLYFSNSGKNVGDFMGHKATGKTAVWDGMAVYLVKNDKIAEAWFTEDLLAMFIQLDFF